MIKVENIEVFGWKAAFRGMRNPLNSWSKSDSTCEAKWGDSENFVLGKNDLDLACRLIKAGTEHRKFLRMIHIQMDIVAPPYWIAEHDTYKIGTTRNSCSFMHKGVSKPFCIEDFSVDVKTFKKLKTMETVVNSLNELREEYLKTKDEATFQMIRQLLPSSYNIRYTWDCSMETILNILHQRNHHRLPEWQQFRQSCFENIPYCKEFYEAMYN